MTNEMSQVQLTPIDINPKLDEGGKTMVSDGASEFKGVGKPGAEEGASSDGGQKEDPEQLKQPEKGRDNEEADKKKVKEREADRRGKAKDPEVREKLTREWDRVKESGRNIDPQIIQKLIEDGYGPSDVTSKGLVSQTALEVINNSELDDQTLPQIHEAALLLSKDHLTEGEKNYLFEFHKERLSMAKRLLEVEELSPEQKLAILRAHYEGFEEEGLDGSQAKVFNYTKKQLARKVEALRAEGTNFNDDQIRVLVEGGIAAMNFNYTIPEIQNIAGIFRLMRAAGTIDASTISTLRQEAMEFGLANQNLPNIQDEISEFYRETTRAMREFGRGRDKASDLQFAFKEALDSHPDAQIKIEEIRDNEREIFRLQGIQNRDANMEAELEMRHARHRRLDRELYSMEILDHGSGNNFRRLSMRDVIEMLPISNGYIEADIVEAISASDKALEFLMSRIIDPPTDQETNNYQIDFQAGINLALIKNVLMSRSQHNDPDRTPEDNSYLRSKSRVQYESSQIEAAAIQIFHEVNRALVTGQFEGAGAALRPEHWEYLQRKLGAGAMHRYIERRYYTAIAQEKFVSGQTNDRIMGVARDPYTGRPMAEQADSILAAFVEHKANAQQLGQHLRDNGLVGNEAFDEISEMDTWEIVRARNLGRILYSISERPAEVLALGDLPDKRKDLSFYREDSIRIVDQLKFIYKRWEISAKQGGMKFQVFRRRFFDQEKESDGYRRLDIETMLNGQEINWIESVGDIGISGVYSTWREMEIILPRIKINWEGGPDVVDGVRTIAIGGNNYRIATLNDLFMTYDRLSHHDKASFLKQVFLDDHGDLRNEFRSGIGIIARRLLPSAGDFGSPHGFSEALKSKLHPKDRTLVEVKNRIRTKLWERAAEDEPLIIASFLHGMRYRKGANLPAGIDREVKIFGSGGKIEELGVDWAQFERKMTWFGEVRTTLNMHGEKLGIREVMRREGERGGVVLTDDEVELYEYIVRQGQHTAVQFANVKFNIEPFMTDVPFEILDISRAGPTFIKRRLSGDWGAAMGSHKAMGGLLGNVAGTDPHKAAEILAEMSGALASPYGRDAAIKKIHPMVMALGLFYEKGGFTNNHEDGETWWSNTINSVPLRQLRKSLLGDAYLTFTRKPKSIAQQYAGLEAPAFDENDMYVYGEELVKIAVLDHEYFNKYKKKFAGLLRGLMWLLRDAFLLGAIAATAHTIKEGAGADEFKG